MNKRHRQLLALALLVSVIFVGGVALFSQMAWSSLLDAFNWVSHTREVEQEIEHLVSNLDDAEAGQHAYLLTQKERYLKPYNAALPLIGDDFKRIRDLTSDNATQQHYLDALSGLIDKKLQMMALTVSLERAGHHDQALAVVNAGKGEETMDEMRRIIASMTSEEGRLLDIRDGVFTKQAFTNRAITLGIVGLHIGLIAVVACLVWRLSRMRTLVTVCAWSKNVEYEGKWISFEEYLRRRFGVRTSHGVSPEEAEKIYSELDKEREEESAGKRNT